MKIQKDTTVSVEYTLKNEKGEILDSSNEMGEPLKYIHGFNMIISGLEKELEGKKAGDEFSTVIPPDDAYGNVIDELIIKTKRSQFPKDVELKVGMEFEAGEGHHASIVRITKIEGDDITIDGNHPLAGQTLYFDVKVISVNETTEEELEALKKELSSCGCGGCSCTDDDEISCGCGCSGCH